MSEATDMRPRGITGTMHNGQIHGVAIADVPKPKHVDGDDMTWDWWQALGEAGYFTVGPDGGLDVAGYDTRTGPERLEHIITELVQRVETLEAIIRDWAGDGAAHCQPGLAPGVGAVVPPLRGRAPVPAHVSRFWVRLAVPGLRMIRALIDA